MDTAVNISINSSDLGADEDVYWRKIDGIAFDIQTYYLWIILALGFPGNCATIATVIKMSPAKSLTVYIALLAVVDNLAIINKLLIIVLLDNKINIGQTGCKLLGYFGNFLITFGNWLLVGMSAERFAAVWFPFVVGQRWTFKKSIWAVILLALPLVCLFLHLFWIMKFYIDQNDGNYFCDIHSEYKYFMMHIWFWINVAIYAIIPCTLLLIFNGLIIIGIVKSGRTKKILNVTHGQKKHGAVDRHRPITIMLVTAAVTLVILTTPRCILLIIQPYWKTDGETTEGAVRYLLDTIAFVLCDFTHAVNFYVYSLSNKRFRQQLYTFFMCRCRKGYSPACSVKYTNSVGRSPRKSTNLAMTQYDSCC